MYRPGDYVLVNDRPCVVRKAEGSIVTVQPEDNPNEVIVTEQVKWNRPQEPRYMYSCICGFCGTECDSETGSRSMTDGRYDTDDYGDPVCPDCGRGVDEELCCPECREKVLEDGSCSCVRSCV